MGNSPYGKVVILKEQATEVECWNFNGNSKHILPAGTRLKLEHVNESDSTTCMLVDKDGNHKGIMLKHADGTEQRGYRFVLKNEQLNRLADAGLPDKAFDLVGTIMAYEQGDLDEEATTELFVYLRDNNILNSLQGHYGRTARSLGVVA